MDMEKALEMHLIFTHDTFPGFIDTVKLIFRCFPEKQEDIFNFVRSARDLKDTDYLAEIRRIVGYTQ